MKMYDKMDELRAHSGVGSCLYAKNETGKYSIFMPLESAPSVQATPASIDIDVTSSDKITKIEGKATLEEKETEFFMHRDNIRRAQAYSDKGIIDFMLVNSDFTGVKFSATISFVQNDATSTDPLHGTLKITPVKDEGFVDNCYDLIQPTAKFTNGISPTVEVAKDGTLDVLVETDPVDATVTATSETPTIATVSYSAGKATISGVAKGSCIIKLVSSKNDYASWETTIHVVVTD